ERVARVAEGDADALGSFEAQLFGDDAREHRPRAGADVLDSRADLDRAVLVDVHLHRGGGPARPRLPARGRAADAAHERSAVTRVLVPLSGPVDRQSTELPLVAAERARVVQEPDLERVLSDREGELVQHGLERER